MLFIEYILNRSVNTLAVLYSVLKSSFGLCLHLFPFLTRVRVARALAILRFSTDSSELLLLSRVISIIISRASSSLFKIFIIDLELTVQEKYSLYFDICRQILNIVISTSMHRRCFDVMCLLGSVL